MCCGIIWDAKETMDSIWGTWCRANGSRPEQAATSGARISVIMGCRLILELRDTFPSYLTAVSYHFALLRGSQNGIYGPLFRKKKHFTEIFSHPLVKKAHISFVGKGWQCCV
jgi:hypothetical protein